MTNIESQGGIEKVPDKTVVFPEAAAMVPDQEVTMSAARELRKTVLEQKVLVGEAYMDLAESIWQVYKSRVNNQPLWTLWGYANFQEYASGELDMNRTKAYYLMQVWGELRVRIGMTKDEISQIQWGKSKELAGLSRAGVLTSENSTDWLNQAKDLTVLQLNDLGKTAKSEHRKGLPASRPVSAHEDTRHTGGVSGAPDSDALNEMADKIVKLYRWSGAFPEDQYENLISALGLAEQISGASKKTRNLDYICTSFIANNIGNTKSTRVETLKRVATMLGLNFNVDIVVVDRDTQTVLVGGELLDGES